MITMKINNAENTQNTGQMAWRTCFSSISYYGYKLDILKSGAQKYLRRREEDKMLWCLGEIYLFHVFAKTQNQRKCARGIVTNIINRLIIMMDEELLFAEWNIYLICRSLLEKFEKSNRSDFMSLIKVCKILVRSELLRLNSDIRGYFDRGMRHWGVKKPAIKIKEIKTKQDYFSVGNGIHKEIMRLRKEGDDEKCLLYMANFMVYFEKGDPNCFYWVFKLIRKSEEGVSGGRRFNRRDCEYIIWEYLLKKSEGNNYLKKCLNYKLKEYYVKTRGERAMWLTASIMLVMKKDELDWDPRKMYYDIDVDESSIHKIFKNRKKMVIDDYAIDMHCSLGRKMGKNKLDFVHEGSLVVNENQEYFVKEWRDMYNGGKIQSFKKAAERKVAAATAKKTKNRKIAHKKGDGPSKSTIRREKEKRINTLKKKPVFAMLEEKLDFIDQSEFDEKKMRICLLTTCGNKAMCFEYGGFIWKEGRQTMNYNRDYICVDNCKLAFGLKPIIMTRILSNFTLKRVDKTNKSWQNNWHKVSSPSKIVYCRMRKVGDGEELIKNKEMVKNDRGTLTELVKIAIFRGIFRVSDFNLKNVLIDGADLVSVDEGDIGKRVGIIGGRNTWLVREINKNKGLVAEVLADIHSNKEGKLEGIKREMKKYVFTEELMTEVEKNWGMLEKDLQLEGIMIND